MLNNKVIVVTGGNGLIGKSFVSNISKHGGIAIVADFDQKGQIFSKSVNNSDFFKIDITDTVSVKKCIEYVFNKYGKIDALVNSAYPKNKNFGRSFFDVEYDDLCENINLNLGGYFLTTQIFCKFFKKQGFGNIVNLSSIYGLISPKFEIYENTKMTVAVEYSMIKSALIHFTKYTAKFLKNSNIRINCISPGGIFDNQNELFLKNYNLKCLNKGMLSPDDISGSLMFLLSENSKYINGQNIVVDDGFTL